MKFLKSLYIIAHLFAVCLQTGNTQSKTMTLSAQLSINSHNTFGNNIYAKNHDKSVPFLALQIETTYKSKAFMAFTLANVVHYSNSKLYIQNGNTIFRQRLFSFGYHFPLKSWLHLAPSFYIGTGNGENDGKFNGLVLGFGAQATVKIWKRLSGFLKTDYLRYNFAIRSTSELERLFDHTKAIIAGGGVRYQF